MHIAKYYNKPHCKAFVILGYCSSFNQIILEVELFELHEKIKLPINDVEFRIIDEYKYANMVVVAFPLHPSIPFAQGDWIELTKENAELLRPRKYRIETNHSNIN